MLELGNAVQNSLVSVNSIGIRGQVAEAVSPQSARICLPRLVESAREKFNLVRGSHYTRGRVPSIIVIPEGLFGVHPLPTAIKGEAVDEYETAMGEYKLL